jgi:outer membrane protein TolC
VAETVRLRVNDGRELPIEVKRAELNLARARQRQQALESDQRYAGSLLASLLGLDTNQEIRVAVEDRAPAPLAAGEEACAEAALASSKEVRRLESALTAKGFEVRADRSAKLPRLELVAQYALLGRYNNYQEFFAKFQRHNGEIGVSFQVPLFAGIAADAMAAQAESESAKLRLELQAARNRIAMDARRLYQQAKNAESAREVARLDLEVTRDQLSVLLAQMEEGRASLKQVEEARLAEDDKWLAFVESSYAVETARLNLLHQTGELLAALRP